MRRKKRNMKTIEMTLPACPIGISDACFRVKDKDGIIGELQVSKGAIVWFPKDAKKGYRLTWSRFDRLACEYGYQCECR